MFKNLRKQAEGFTIIEVMIVLVIAAVILLIVFLAVPALQRNSRNTQRKNDVASVLSAMNEYANNNGGKYPTTAQQQSDALANAKLGFYQSGNVTYGSTSTANPSNTENAVIVVNGDCATSGGTVVAKNRTVAVMYTVETGSSPQNICQSE